MPTAFCEEADVRKALQKVELKGSIGSEFITPAIHAASDWFARQTNGYWFDSGGGTTLVSASNASASDVVLDVPSSPHAGDRQHISSKRDARYPVTTAGPYARIPLPHLYVTNLTKLEVRDRGGDVDDWVVEKTEGVGEDYYLQTQGQNSYGRTYLHLDARGIGARLNFDSLLTLAYDYGLDADSAEWDDVRRGVAMLAAAEVVSEDAVLTQIPESGTLVGVETQHDQLTNAADAYLRPYLSAMGDNR